MSKVQKVVNKIEGNGFSCRLNQSPPIEILWRNVNYHIYECDIAETNDSLAWLQSSDGDDHLLIVYHKDNVYTWVPETYNPAFGCECIHIGWRKEFLIFVYLEKHDIYICKITNDETKHFHFNGQDIFIGEDIITYSSFGGTRKGKVNLINLSSFDKVEKISTKEAEVRNIKPIYYQELDG